MASSSITVMVVAAILVAVVAMSPGGSVEARKFTRDQGYRLTAGQGLSAGQYIGWEHHNLVMQADCNLVFYDSHEKPLGATNTYMAGEGCYVVMQEDGNLVVRDQESRAVWASGTNGEGDSKGHSLYIVRLLAEPGSPETFMYELIIYSISGRPLWQSSKSATFTPQIK